MWLSSENIRTIHLTKKLDYKWLGPYVVKQAISRSAYRLKLPTSFGKIHPVFSVTLLHSFKGDLISEHQEHHPPPPPPIICDGSVGEVWSGPVLGHFCWTGDLTVPSLMKYLGPGLGPPGTVYISLVPVQTWSRPGPDSPAFHFIYFSSYNACEGHVPSATQSPLPDVLSSSVYPLHHQPHEMYVSHQVLPC